MRALLVPRVLVRARALLVQAPQVPVLRVLPERAQQPALLVQQRQVVRRSPVALLPPVRPSAASASQQSQQQRQSLLALQRRRVHRTMQHRPLQQAVKII